MNKRGSVAPVHEPGVKLVRPSFSVVLSLETGRATLAERERVGERAGEDFDVPPRSVVNTG